MDLGDICMGNNDIAGAEKEFRKAVKLEPCYSEAHNCLGDALLVQEDAAGAEKAYREAIAESEKCQSP